MTNAWTCAICRQPQSAIVCTTCPSYAARVKTDAAAERECEWLELQRALRRQARWRTAELVAGTVALALGIARRRRA